MGKKKNQPEPVPEEKKDFQIVILGGGGVGKSCLTFRLVHSEFLSKYDPTIEDSYRKDNFRVNDEICPLEILDTAGQDIYSGMRDNYYRSGDGFLLVYSVDVPESTKDVEERFHGIIRARNHESGMPPPPIMIVGNKCDLEGNSRKVSKEEGQDLTKALHLNPETDWIETSAKADINVQKVFEDIVLKVKAERQRVKDDEIAKKPKKKKCIIL